MSDTSSTLYCPNYFCQAANPESNLLCQQCRTPLQKQYLWAVGQSASKYQVGDFLGERYQLKAPQIFLDTKPGLMPETPHEISPQLEPYLRLFAYRLHLPQIYALVPVAQSGEVLLLEQAAIEQLSDSPRPLPSITACWSTASAFRQLNWLWQIAQLWQPLYSERVAASLLDPDLIRVEGSLIRLQKLKLDERSSVEPSLMGLGQLWKQWSESAQPEIQAFLQRLSQSLMQGNLKTAEQLLHKLDQALQICRQTQTRQIQIVTQSDQGPSRQRNEDACYPLPGSQQGQEGFPQMAIVCDGIGGHEGGDVASHWAIESVQHQLQQLTDNPTGNSPEFLQSVLEQAILAANDRISERNDHEHRQERKRMGTTLVGALVHHHELYLMNVGDSRAYLITQQGCHQMTLDDDLASREVRMGYAFYRDALQMTASGSLIQALGMSRSSSLHPVVQRYLLDEDCLILLCSDGLSDHDRVESSWKTEILPVLQHQIDLVQASQRLIQLANTQNGHDNTTVALLYCQVAPSEINPETLQTQLQSLVPSQTTSAATATRSRTWGTANSGLRFYSWLFLGGVAVLATGFLLVPQLLSQLKLTDRGNLPAASPSQPAAPSPSPSVSSSVIPLEVGTILKVGRSNENATPRAKFLIAQSTPPVPLTSSPGSSGETAPAKPAVFSEAIVPEGSLLKVLRVESIAGQGLWVQLQACSVPVKSKTIQDTPVLQPGAIGWIGSTQVQTFVTRSTLNSPQEISSCP